MVFGEGDAVFDFYDAYHYTVVEGKWDIRKQVVFSGGYKTIESAVCYFVFGSEYLFFVGFCFTSPGEECAHFKTVTFLLRFESLQDNVNLFFPWNIKIQFVGRVALQLKGAANEWLFVCSDDNGCLRTFHNGHRSLFL